MDCKHEESEVWVSYCSGFTKEGLTVDEVMKCKRCGWTWRTQHQGHYIQDTETKIID